MGRFSVGKQGAYTREPYPARAAYTAAAAGDLRWFSGAYSGYCQVSGYRGIVHHLPSGQ
ncbi:hypothetical protein D3C72_2011820 [compost metagenome]